LLLPNCFMSLSSAECRYSLGTGRKKWTCVKAELQNQPQLEVEQIHMFYHMIRHPTPRLFIPKMILPGKSPIGSSIFRTLKKTELPYGRVLNILRNWFLASSFDKCSWMQQQSTWVIEVSHILSNANLDHKIYYSLQVSAWDRREYFISTCIKTKENHI
jgi:hypothetical protein